jgi:SAM-dependent methyltransferase
MKDTMNNDVASRMRAYWDDRARVNAAWYVDTSIDFDTPDMQRFFETGDRIVEEAVTEAPVQPGGRDLAVEIGSGLGRNCLALTREFAEVVGVDVSPEMVGRARELVPSDRVRFVVGNGCSLSSVADGSADFVLSFTVFQHIPDVSVIEGYLAEAGRVLRSGGVVAFQWNNLPGAWLWPARRRVLSLLQSTGLRPERHGRHAPEFLGSRVTRRRITRALDSAGLDVAGIKGGGTLFAWACARKR